MITKNISCVLLLPCMLIFLSSANSQISLPSGMTLIRNKHAFMADTGLIASFATDCVNNQYQQPTRQSQSIETIIDLVERLEDVLANTTDPILSKLNGPENVARMLLHRFHVDDVDFNTMTQSLHLDKMAQIDTQIVSKPSNIDNDYYFPDYIYNNEEKCSLLYAFSHIFLNNSQTTNTRRFRRAVYNLQRGNSPSQSPFLPSEDVNPIQEKGVVSYREDSMEAIAVSRVFYGIIAGLTKEFQLSAKQILNEMGYRNTPTELTIKDPILAVTLGSLMGTSTFYEASSNVKFDPKLIYGVTGRWQNETCSTYYAITSSISHLRDLRNSNRGSMAQIRGALDGYIIGNSLKNFDEKPSKLSTILKSYYSKSRSSNNNKYGISYCDRANSKPDKSVLLDVATTYNSIFNTISNQEGFTWKSDAFNTQLDQAANTQEICSSKPGGNLDRNSPCETPSDLIFVIDPKSETLNQTAGIVSDVISKINKIGRYAGKVSVFVNSNSRNNVELPNGPGGWPMPALVFNSTNVGSVMCQLNPEKSMSPQINLGKYLHNVNQTVFNYKSWSPRYFTGVPSKNVILIDQGSLQMATGGVDRDEYNNYRDWFRYRNRDILLLVAANNQTNFKEVVRQEANLVSTNQGKIGTLFESKICDNPAALTYNQCYEKPSQDFAHEGFVTPGYRQNWAIFPEYMLKSRQIQIKVKAVGGSLKYCYDRDFPPEKQEYCKDLQENGEEMFEIWNPCHHESLESCKPIFITIWGKEKNSICKDPECQSLDQIKFAISHTGIACNSALKHGSFILLQAALAIFAILAYLV